MENKFECGDGAFLRVTVCAVYNEGNVYDYDVSCKDHDTGEEELIPVIEEQLTTASVAPNIDWQAVYNEYSEKAQRKIEALTKQLEEANETIKAFSESENIVRTNFTAKCDEIMVLKSENERLSKQNEELGTKADDLEAELQNAQKSIDYNNKMEKSRTRLVDGQTLTIYRRDKTINILIDKIVSLEMMLDEEREKHNG